MTEEKPSTAAEKEPAEKHPRRRKRQKYNEIRLQMEFYFGDANLLKDRFLGQLLKEDPFVPIEVFLTFNKMKKLTESAEDIKKSLAKSEMLQLSECKTKVQRITPIDVNRNPDEHTIYVESLPPTADHDWIRNVFSEFGGISYVSLPRYRSSKKIKEFAFVEFEHKSSVEKAIKSFKKTDSVIEGGEIDAADLQSITSYVKEQEEIAASNVKKEHTDSDQKKLNKKRKLNEIEPSSEPLECFSAKMPNTEAKESGTDETPSAATKKRKRRDKRKRQAEQESSQTNSKSDDDECAAKRPKIEDAPDSTDVAVPATPEEDAAALPDSNPTEKKKKNRRHKNAPKEFLDFRFVELKIMSKINWKRLRNVYLNMQREKLRELKKMYREEQFSENKPKLQSKSPDDVCTNNVDDAPAEDKPGIEFQSGVIVEIKFREPCVDVKDFKEEMRQFESVKYVDVKEGDVTAYVRVENREASDTFVSQCSCIEYSGHVLTGQREHEYWEKINHDREQKRSKGVKVQQKRGREKMAKKTASHIHFDKDDEDN